MDHELHLNKTEGQRLVDAIFRNTYVAGADMLLLSDAEHALRGITKAFCQLVHEEARPDDEDESEEAVFARTRLDGITNQRNTASAVAGLLGVFRESIYQLEFLEALHEDMCEDRRKGERRHG